MRKFRFIDSQVIFSSPPLNKHVSSAAAPSSCSYTSAPLVTDEVSGSKAFSQATCADENIRQVLLSCHIFSCGPSLWTLSAGHHKLTQQFVSTPQHFVNFIQTGKPLSVGLRRRNHKLVSSLLALA